MLGKLGLVRLNCLCTDWDTCPGRDKCILYALVGMHVNSGIMHLGNMHSGLIHMP